MTRFRPSRALPGASLLLPVLLAVACGGEGDRAPAAGETAAEGPPAPATAPASALSPAVLRELGVRNGAMPAADLVTAGQITPDQMDALAAAGVRTFISLRLPDENGAGWEEEAAQARGIRFRRIPVAGSEGLTRDRVEELAAALEAADGPVALYCGSSNRVGAMLALKAAWLDGRSPEEALAFGKEAGMTRLEPAVRKLLGLN